MLFDQFGEIPSDELPERAVVEPEPPGQRLHAFGCRAVQVHGLAVFLHAAAGHRSRGGRLRAGRRYRRADARYGN